jgi:hypothetical protein
VLCPSQRPALNSPPSQPPSDALRAAADNVEPALAACAPSPEDTRALINQAEDSPEIPETPTVTINDIRRERDNQDDGVIDVDELRINYLLGSEDAAGEARMLSGV